MTPAQRRYQQPPMETTEAAIHPSPAADLYAVLGEGDAERGWAVRLYWKPMVSWIWLGALIMACGGFLSLSDRRHRVGAPARRATRSEEHTSELQSLMRISYAVFCLNKTQNNNH